VQAKSGKRPSTSGCKQTAAHSLTLHRPRAGTCYIERVLADISRSRYVVIATQPVHRLQILQWCTTRGTPLPFPQVISGPWSVVGMRPQTDRHRRAWPIYISRRLRLTRNV